MLQMCRICLDEQYLAENMIWVYVIILVINLSATRCTKAAQLSQDLKITFGSVTVDTATYNCSNYHYFDIDVKLFLSGVLLLCPAVTLYSKPCCYSY